VLPLEKLEFVQVLPLEKLEFVQVLPLSLHLMLQASELLFELEEQELLSQVSELLVVQVFVPVAG
jgi:hypothetical protein